MRCRKVRHELAGFVNKTLDQPTMRAIGDHLWYCSNCADEERRSRSAVEVLRRVEPETPPPPLLDSTRRKVAAVREEISARDARGLRKIWGFSPTTLVVACCLLVASGLLVAHSSTNGQKIRELRQLQQKIQAQRLVRQTRLLQREMPRLADQMLLAGVELVLREVENLDGRSPQERALRDVQQRLAVCKAAESLNSLIRRAETRDREVLRRLLSAVERIEKL